MSQYHIHSSQKSPHEQCAKIALKHAEIPWQKPISDQQRKIFATVDRLITSTPRPIILDSCCGTANSSFMLAQENPDCWVIGVDKSLVRLNRNAGFRQQNDSIYQQQNLMVVRADVCDFWRLITQHNWRVSKHYLLYPNPYPKKSQFTKRWHGHPVFPELLQISSTIEVRSNWRIYLEEFSQAALLLNSQLTSTITKISPNETALTAFEKKYHDNEITCWRLLITMKQDSCFRRNDL